MICLCVCVRVCVRFTFFDYSPLKGGRTWIVSPEWKSDKADFRDWMPFLSSHLIEEIRPNPEALSTDT